VKFYQIYDSKFPIFAIQHNFQYRFMELLKSFLRSIFFRNLAIAVLILFILIIGIMYWLDFVTNHNQKILVPDLSEKSLLEVDKILTERKMHYIVIDSANFNPDYPRFSVIDQAPKPGSFVKENRKIYLTINPSNFGDVTLPNVIQKTYRQAEPTLKSMGFIIGDTVYQRNIGRDVVLEIQFKGEKVNPGEKLKKTSKIDLILGDGNNQF